jgi:uncharacterized membrane protein
VNEVVIPGIQERPHQSLRNLTYVMYGLHLASFFSAGIFSVIAIIINVVKYPDLPDDFYRSHFRWQARSFWFTLLWLALTLPLWLLLVPGYVAWALIGLWYMYRFIRGTWCLFDDKAMPA